jgi:hypothetical protein
VRISLSVNWKSVSVCVCVCGGGGSFRRGKQRITSKMLEYTVLCWHACWWMLWLVLFSWYGNVLPRVCLMCRSIKALILCHIRLCVSIAVSICWINARRCVLLVLVYWSVDVGYWDASGLYCCVSVLRRCTVLIVAILCSERLKLWVKKRPETQQTRPPPPSTRYIQKDREKRPIQGVKWFKRKNHPPNTNLVRNYSFPWNDLPLQNSKNKTHCRNPIFMFKSMKVMFFGGN